MNVSKTPAQLLCAASKRLVAHGATVAVGALVSIIAIWLRGSPPTVEKLPTAARRDPSGETSKRTMLVVPAPS
jgi:hypothetical protein